MIDLSEIVNDSDLNAQSFVIQRSQGGVFGPGGWMDESVAIAGFGIIQPATDEDLKMIPEGDSVAGAITIFSQQQLFRTRTGSNIGISDIVTWQGQTYRVMSSGPWLDYGFWKTIATKMTPDAIQTPAPPIAVTPPVPVAPETGVRDLSSQVDGSSRQFNLGAASTIIPALSWNGLIQPTSAYTVTGNILATTFTPQLGDELLVIF